MQELAEARELVALRTRVAMEGVPRVAVAAAALAEPVNREAALRMVASDYPAPSQGQLFSMAAAVGDLLTYQRSALVATVVAAQAPEPSQMVLQAQTV
jgi:hypothetical protein